MWKVDSKGMSAVNQKTGLRLSIAYCSDELYRVKKNYKTIGTFKNLEDAKIFLANKLTELSREQ